MYDWSFYNISKKLFDVRFKNKIKSIFWYSIYEKLEILIFLIEVVESVCFFGVWYLFNIVENKLLYCK